MRKGGFEPPRPFGHWHLKPARLPFRHLRVVLDEPSQCARCTPVRTKRPEALTAGGTSRDVGLMAAARFEVFGTRTRADLGPIGGAASGRAAARHAARRAARLPRDRSRTPGSAGAGMRATGPS